MNELFSEIFQEVFSPSNLKTLLNHGNPSISLPPLETDFPVRATKNDAGSITIELFASSKFGDFYKPLAVLMDKKAIFPCEFWDLAKKINLMNFHFEGFRKEMDILIGAFSLTSLFEAEKNADVPEFTANGLKYEHVVAFDGTIQCFYKEKIIPGNPLQGLLRTELDDKPLAAFQLQKNPPMIFKTNFSKEWGDIAQSYRLLEIYNPVR